MDMLPMTDSSPASHKMADAAEAQRMTQALREQAQHASAGVEGNTETPSVSAPGSTTAPTPTSALPQNLGRTINATA